jgi:hypothetical protein
MTSHCEQRKNRPSYTRDYARVLSFTRRYLHRQSEENERFIYSALQQFCQSDNSSSARMKAIKLRLFLFHHAQQQQAKRKFRWFTYLECQLKFKQAQTSAEISAEQEL